MSNNTASISKSQVTAALEIAKTALQTIIEAGPSGIPSGHLYAAMMSVFADVQTFESMVSLLIRSGCVTRSNHVLTAVQP